MNDGSDGATSELGDVLITGELARRPSRPPDYEAEAKALATLTQAMASSPQAVLQGVTDKALELCRADSAGISIVEPGGASGPFRWRAVSGQLAGNLGGAIPREASPCGAVLQRDATLLFAYPQRHFRYPVAVDPPMVEALLAPLHAAGKPVGTLWAITHTPERRFDAEDARLLQNLSQSASAAWQMTAALDAAKAGGPVLPADQVPPVGELGGIVASVNIDPLHDREGRINVFVDVTDRKRTEEDLRESREKLVRELEAAKQLQKVSSLLVQEENAEALYEQILDAAVALMHADMGSMQMLDAERESLRLLAWRGFHPESAACWAQVTPQSATSCGAALRAGERLIIPDVNDWEPGQGTEALRQYRLSGITAVQSTPLVTRTGRPVGMISTHWRSRHEPGERELRLLDVLARQAADALDRARTAAALRASEERLRLALQAARMGTWSWEVAADRHRRDANLNQLLGLEPAETVLPIEEFFGHIHPEDRDRVRAAFDASVRQGHNLGLEFRVVWPSGEVRWLRDQGDVFGDADRHLAGACLDITERKRMEHELREADRRKDEFLAMLGHELRNPLAPLRGIMETLQRQRLDGDGLARAYAMMERQVRHLTRLVDDLLDVSRITRGLVELRKEAVNLAEVANRAVEMASPAVEGRGHELNVSLPRQPLQVEGDAVRLTQVVFNLLNNAAKFTDPDGRIGLTVKREGEQAVVRVRDNGSGMEADFVPKVFDLFTQGERTPDRSQGGLGLGLTLVKRLVEMHGGTVEAWSEGPARGSEFTVRLPALASEAAKPAPAHVTAPPPAAVQVSRALVIDDNFDVAESFTWMLEGLAQDIKMVHSGAAALELVSGWKPDVIVCDIGMTGMDGFETCRRLRQVPGLEKVIIAAVTGYEGEEDRRKTQEAGFDRHLVKPIGRATMEELVKSAANG